jgi:hypothetical protein
MINHENLYDDLKVLFLSSGYLTEDESCGYDELMFAVRKDYLFAYLKSDEIKTLEDMEKWLREEYTSDDTYGLYQQAKQEGEIVFEKRVWNNRRAVFYEVGEGLRDGLEEEEKIYIRTFDYDTAKQAFEVERDRLLEDDSFFLKDEEPDAEQSFDFGYAKIRYENDDGDFYELYLRQVEVEEEGRNYK